MCLKNELLKLYTDNPTCVSSSGSVILSSSGDAIVHLQKLQKVLDCWLITCRVENSVKSEIFHYVIISHILKQSYFHTGITRYNIMFNFSLGYIWLSKDCHVQSCQILSLAFSTVHHICACCDGNQQYSWQDNYIQYYGVCLLGQYGVCAHSEVTLKKNHQQLG